MADMLNVRVTPYEKHALRKLAADQNMDMSRYVLQVLRSYTPLTEVANSLAEGNPRADRIEPKPGKRHARR